MQAGHWQLTDSRIATMREYLLRGGFFMADDVWGDNEWEIFMQTMRRVFPVHDPVELSNDDPIFPRGLRSERTLPGGERRVSAARLGIRIGVNYIEYAMTQ